MSNNAQEASKALQLEGRMQNIIRQGYALMEEMQAPPTQAYATVMALVWSQEALEEMPVSLGIIQKALADIQAQCPALAEAIFPQEPTDEQ